jgi:hypothetical protein
LRVGETHRSLASIGVLIIEAESFGAPCSGALRVSVCVVRALIASSVSFVVNARNVVSGHMNIMISLTSQKGEGVRRVGVCRKKAERMFCKRVLLVPGVFQKVPLVLQEEQKGLRRER